MTSIFNDILTSNRDISRVVSQLQSAGKQAASSLGRQIDREGQIQTGALQRAGDLRIEGLNQKALFERVSGYLQRQSANQQSEAIRNAAKQFGMATAFNASIARLNTKRQLEDLEKQKIQVLGQQVVNTAARGISRNSKSAVNLANRVVNEFNKSIRETAIDAAQQARANMFQAEAKSKNLIDQANAAKFQGTVSALTSAIRLAQIGQQIEAVEDETALAVRRATTPRFRAGFPTPSRPKKGKDTRATIRTTRRGPK